MDPAATGSSVTLGSLVRADGVYYYLSVPLGKMDVDGQAVMALSLQSPLGSKLKGLRAGDRVTLNGRELRVEDVS